MFFPAPLHNHHTYKVNDNHGLISNHPGVVPCRSRRHPLLYSISVPSSHLYPQSSDIDTGNEESGSEVESFILDFASISTKFTSHHRLFPLRTKNIFTPTCWLRTPLLGQRDLRNSPLPKHSSPFTERTSWYSGRQSTHLFSGWSSAQTPQLSCS